MPLKRDSAEDPFNLNLTPMVDVVFLLVIFFMTATQFAEVERAVDLELPTVNSDGADVAAVVEPRIVAVSASGELTLDGQAKSLEAIQAELRAARESHPTGQAPAVLLHGDARCDFQHVAAALAGCRAAGVSDVGVSVETVETIRR